LPQPHAGSWSAHARRLSRGAALTATACVVTVAPAWAADGGGAEAGATPAPTAAAPAAQPAGANDPASVVITRATIRSVQRKLGRRVDGVYGRDTKRAVRGFQKRHRLPVDGRLGPQTLAALGVSAKTRSVPAPPAPSGGTTSKLLKLIANCESGGDPTAVSAGGQHRGKYQFLRSTWQELGGAGDPAKAPELEQDQRAGALLADQGTKPWPTCGRKAKAELSSKGS
jgi:peptidoglycan hydrolase-like protein with peptidoglycan-binding domain